MKALIITTFNREESFKVLFESIPFHKLDWVIVVNAGEPYSGYYGTDKCNVSWIQLVDGENIATTRNKGLEQAKRLGIEHIFLSEDDMIIKDENIFDEYIHAAEVSGLKYFCFTSYAWESGPPGNRTPRVVVEYKDANGKVIPINFAKNMCNEFTYRHVSLLDEVGFYDEKYTSLFDVDWVYRASNHPAVGFFWYFADLGNSDNLIKNNDQTKSAIDPDGNRWASKLTNDNQYFMGKHGKNVSGIELRPQNEFVNKLKALIGK